MKTAIVDYGMGNLRSVQNAFAAIGSPASVALAPAELATADAIVLPGVGAFADGMSNLRTRGWVEALEREVRERGKPFLGLCLGQQLLATTGTEHGVHAGLGWISGTVERFSAADGSIRIPQIGWNEVQFARPEPMYAGLGESRDFYFVHSYILKPADAGVVSGFCHHGERFAASVVQENIWATQYHPEKSQKAGLAVLRNFVSTWAPRC
jgi:imidazole glycerol-phosphate synthase subunit HisH